jgi:hypothetical protein
LNTHIELEAFVRSGRTEYVKFLVTLLHYFFSTFGADITDRVTEANQLVEEHYDSLYDGFKLIISHPEWAPSQAAYFLHASDLLNKKKLAWKATVAFTPPGLNKSDVAFIHETLEKILMEEGNYDEPPDDRKGE